jgi:hypothetical protein
MEKVIGELDCGNEYSPSPAILAAPIMAGITDHVEARSPAVNRYQFRRHSDGRRNYSGIRQKQLKDSHDHG